MDIVLKLLKYLLEPLKIKVPRDRKAEFEPQIIKKCQTILDEFEHQIIALYSKGITTRDIQEILSEMYGFNVSHH